ncbi:MAG: V-type ATP synthase subunit I [Lawsonibacter sp.]|jgi:V/A-type H+-transporting ATPase subunit I|nr:V-type ATP synthase subunit I [Lawsonibacter sp.]
MAIVKMKRLRMVGMAGDREELLRKLQHMGCVEVIQPEADQEDPVWSALTRPDTGGLAAAHEEKAQAERALEVLKRYTPAKGGLLDPKPGVPEGDFLSEERAERARQAAKAVNDLDRRLAAIRAEENKLEAQKEVLRPWMDLDLPLETGSTPQVAIQLGTLPANVPMNQAEGEVQAAGGLAQLTEVYTERDFHYCMLVCHASQAEGVLEKLKALGWSRANLRDWTGTAAENLGRLYQETKALREEAASIEEELAGMGELNAPLRQLSDLAGANAQREESRGRLLDTAQTFLLEGWVPAESWPQLEKALAAYPCACEVSDPAPEDYPQVPVKLKNNILTKPLNMVTEMYSLPAYGTLDPNPLMAPFFILFYGIMMADMGYGLLMMLAGAVILKKKKPGGTFGHLCGLLVLCGVTTFIMGALTGGFFGDFLTQVVKLTTGGDFALPALFTPLEDTMMILVGAMCLGFVQIITGMAVSFVSKLKNGQVMDAVFEEVTWWIVFAGLGLMIAGITPIVLALGGVLVVAGPVVQNQGFGKVTGIFGSLYNHVTGYFGDILSYSRLMALMLAGSVIAQVFNTLGAIPGNIVIFLIISFAGNTLNFALNLLGCYVHDLRLQCLEYFGKFYQDGGRPFRPLDLNTKYYDVVK